MKSFPTLTQHRSSQLTVVSDSKERTHSVREFSVIVDAWYLISVVARLRASRSRRLLSQLRHSTHLRAHTRRSYQRVLDEYHVDRFLCCYQCCINRASYDASSRSALGTSLSHVDKECIHDCSCATVELVARSSVSVLYQPSELRCKSTRTSSTARHSIRTIP
jgi:hypothetical protein